MSNSHSPQNPSPNSPPTAIPIPIPIPFPFPYPYPYPSSSSLSLPHHQPHILSLSPPKKPQPAPWTHEETLNLIRAYQEKWYALKRGQLKASHWEEVAVTIAARCGFDEPSKSATQCRHKIEKLRKRYKAEKLKNGPTSWAYFSLMDHLHRGPLPISAVAPTSGHQSSAVRTAVGGGGEFFGGGSVRGRGESCGFLERGNGYERELGMDEGRDEIEEERESEEERENVGDLGVEMRGFVESFMKLERRKMEVMRETERFRMEMENKRLEMILVSQKKTVDMITKVFGGVDGNGGNKNKKMKMMMTQDL